MSRSPHPIPRPGIDPISCADDALAVLALGAPYGDDTVAIVLDERRCGTSVLVVHDTLDADALFDVIDACVMAASEDDAAIVLASSRPDGEMVGDDAMRWMEASDQCRAGGLELLEWFVIGRRGPTCPRELFGEPPRW